MVVVVIKELVGFVRISLFVLEVRKGNAFCVVDQACIIDRTSSDWCRTCWNRKEIGVQRDVDDEQRDRVTPMRLGDNMLLEVHGYGSNLSKTYPGRSI